jgi:hypothetical protein
LAQSIAAAESVAAQMNRLRFRAVQTALCVPQVASGAAAQAESDAVAIPELPQALLQPAADVSLAEAEMTSDPVLHFAATTSVLAAAARSDYAAAGLAAAAASPAAPAVAVATRRGSASEAERPD